MEEIKRVMNSLKKKEKVLVMLAPSFVAEYNYPEIIQILKNIGFNKIVEITFGAKMINREYHKILENEKNKLWIASVCPGIVSIIKQKYPEYQKNIIPVDSPMSAMAKIIKKYYPKHKILFASPCNFKKIEAKEKKNKSKINYILNYQEMNKLIKNLNSNKKIQNKKNLFFDKFYNDYTKIYPITGGLSKTAHLKGIISKKETIILDGIIEFEKFMNKKDNLKKIRFIDANFCKGGCLGGPCLSEKNLFIKRKKLLHYFSVAKKEKIPEGEKGIIKEAKGISFRR